jgi:hypothetical protein
VLNVPLLLDKEEGVSDEQQGSRGRRRFKRDSVLPDRAFRPLRITLYYDPVSIDPLPVSKQIYINVSSKLHEALAHRYIFSHRCCLKRLVFGKRRYLFGPRLLQYGLAGKSNTLQGKSSRAHTINNFIQEVQVQPLLLRSSRGAPVLC